MIVTAYYNIYGKPDADKQYLELFRDLGMSGLPITVFTDPSLVELFDGFPKSVIVIGRPLQSFVLYSICANYAGDLPSTRSSIKDTKEFLALMNTKAEFVSVAENINNLGSDTFIWIDFGILKIVKNKDAFIQKLREVNDHTFDKITIPGCWKFGTAYNINRVNWRFCGGVFVLPRKYVNLFFQHNKNVIVDFCTMPQYKLTWETNVWYIVEMCATKDITDWYLADHNDTILLGIDTLISKEPVTNTVLEPQPI